MIGKVKYAETSMRNGFGLKFIYMFFNIPYLCLQRETLINQLDTNAQELNVTYDELDVYEQTGECDYESLVQSICDRFCYCIVWLSSDFYVFN